MKGRPKKPIELQRLRGNPRDKKLPDPLPVGGGEVVAPVWLAGEALEVWRRHAPELAACGLLKPRDADSFAAYCQVVACFVEATREVQEHGVLAQAGNKQAISAVHARYATLMASLGSRFGMSPADRARLADSSSSPPGGTADLFDMMEASG